MEIEIKEAIIELCLTEISVVKEVNTKRGLTKATIKRELNAIDNLIKLTLPKLSKLERISMRNEIIRGVE